MRPNSLVMSVCLSLNLTEENFTNIFFFEAFQFRLQLFHHLQHTSSVSGILLRIGSGGSCIHH
jgi:hypothetical protein